ncbi:MAG: LiaF transmembrane domain-containing protein [Alkalispirochaetaceae bacterium]
MFPRRRFSYPRRLLLFGTLLSVGGGVLLFWTNGLLPSFAALWPLLLFAAGVWQLDHALAADGREATVLTGTVFTLTGLLVFLRTTGIVELEFRRVWPLFMTVAAVSLIAYGFTRPRGARAVLMVPATAMVLLSLIFLLFSLRLVETPFLSFVGRWWPTLLVALGVIFLVRGIPEAIAESGEHRDEE